MSDEEVSYWIRIGHIAGATAIASELLDKQEECDLEDGPCDGCKMFGVAARMILSDVAARTLAWGIEVQLPAPSTETLQ